MRQRIMSDQAIEITSNSNPDSIKEDFNKLNQRFKLQISLEIEVDSEQTILNSVVEQSQSCIHLEELDIIVTKQCILESFNILSEGLTSLSNLKVLSLTFQSECFAGQSHFTHLLAAFKKMNQLTELTICLDSGNSFNQRSAALFSESLTYLNNLKKMSFSLSEGNSFDDIIAEGLVKGFNSLPKLEDFELSFDTTYIREKGMIAISHCLKALSQTLQSLKMIFKSKYKDLLGVGRIFEVLPSFVQLKNIHEESSIELNMKESEEKNIISSLFKLKNLESLCLKKIIDVKCVNEYAIVINSLLNQNSLKKFDLQLLDTNEITPETIASLKDTSIQQSTNMEELILLMKDKRQLENHYLSNVAKSLEKMNNLSTLVLDCSIKVSKADSINLMNSFKYLINLTNLKLILSPSVFMDKETRNQLGESIGHLTKLKQLHLCIPEQLRTEQNFLNLKNLIQLEELILKFVNQSNEEVYYSNQGIIKQLKDIEKLKTLRLRCSLDSNATQSFSTAFSKQAQLKDLELDIMILPNLNYLKQEPFIFQWFCSLKSLQNLKLLLNEHIFTNPTSKSLGNAFSQLVNITTFYLEAGFNTLQCLQNILDGFSNSNLKDLSLNVIEISKEIKLKPLRLFKAVKNLENICIEGDNNFEEPSMYDTFIHQLKELKNLKKINFKIEGSGYLEDLGFKSLVELLQSSTNLLQFSITYGDGEGFGTSTGLDLMQGFKNTNKIRYISMDLFFDQKYVLSFFNQSKQLKNLRSLTLSTYIEQDLSDQKLQNNQQPLFEVFPKYLTKLKMSVSTFSAQFRAYQWLANVLKQIQSFKYLTDLDIALFQFENFKSSSLSNLGLSLQVISQIRNLKLHFILGDECTPESITELSKGIRNQSQLQSLSIEIENQAKIIKISERVIVIMESLQYLHYLTNLKIKFNKSGFEKVHFQSNELLVALGKSLSFMQNLRELDLQILTDGKQQVNEGFISLANSFQKNSTLVNLNIQIEGAEIEANAARRFGEGLSYLKHLETCSIEQTFLIQEVQSLISGINSLEYLSNFTLKCDVDKFEFIPLDLIKKEKQGVYTNELKNEEEDFEYNTEFLSEKTSISIQLFCKQPFNARNYQDLITFWTSLPSNIKISFLDESDLFNEKSFSEYKAPFIPTLSFFSLTLHINSNLDFFNQEIQKIKQIKSLKLVFSQNSHLFMILKSLFTLKKIDIDVLKLVAVKISLQQDSEIQDFINHISKFTQLLKLILDIPTSKPIYLYRQIQKKLTSLIDLSFYDEGYQSNEDDDEDDMIDDGDGNQDDSEGEQVDHSNEEDIDQKSDNEKDQEKQDEDEEKIDEEEEEEIDEEENKENDEEDEDDEEEEEYLKGEDDNEVQIDEEEDEGDEDNNSDQNYF